MSVTFLDLGSRPPYAELVAAWKALRARGDVSVREVACVGASRTLLAVEIAAPRGAATVALSAGVHGDEPAAPWALLSLVRDGLLDRAFGYRIWPCTNPTGYERGTRANAEGSDINRSFNRGGTTPESRAIVTANRDRTFALALDLHEDFEAQGFYAYEPITARGPIFARAIVRAMDENAFAVEDFTEGFDLGYPPEATHLRSLERGIVFPDPALERAYFEGTPYGLYMLRRAAERVATFETPRRLAWDERIAMHRTAVVTALDRLRSDVPEIGADSHKKSPAMRRTRSGHA
ncbi:MAG: succinylglutamate desuccinylase/aspartoacylase family protein [Candidatus Eremiobacteraeota bacterium]|nr:succinylglutamate desuccinylase/aspartoacylase family protein [Candidatus Eremiobacteraeota bacterium]